ncbi:MAG TPA: hypothetical protein VFN09_06615 [Rhodanobacteraceae bacterium]|nr:hypothetical protein [Rhodanobacteraceae bacterium]
MTQQKQRDPRIDPQPADRVRVANETREVMGRYQGRVQYSWPGKLAVRSLSLPEWQRWAGRGEVAP